MEHFGDIKIATKTVSKFLVILEQIDRRTAIETAVNSRESQIQWKFREYPKLR